MSCVCLAYIVCTVVCLAYTAYQSTFYFHDAKERMRVASKELIGHRVCRSLLQQAHNTKIIKRTMKKKEKLHKCNLHKKCCFFHQTMCTNHFLQTLTHRKKKKNTKILRKNYTKNYRHKSTTKITTFAFYRLTKSFSICLMCNNWGCYNTK